MCDFPRRGQNQYVPFGVEHVCLRRLTVMYETVCRIEYAYAS